MEIVRLQIMDSAQKITLKEVDGKHILASFQHNNSFSTDCAIKHQSLGEGETLILRI